MKQNQKKAWLFLAPILILVTVFSIWPIIRAFIMSFQGGPIINMRYNGLSNYQYIFSDPDFWHAIVNTAIYAFVTVPVALIISIALAWFVFSLNIKHFLKQCFSCHTLQAQLQLELFLDIS